MHLVMEVHRREIERKKRELRKERERERENSFEDRREAQQVWVQEVPLLASFLPFLSLSHFLLVLLTFDSPKMRKGRKMRNREGEREREKEMNEKEITKRSARDDHVDVRLPLTLTFSFNFDTFFAELVPPFSLNFFLSILLSSLFSYISFLL